MYIVKITNNTPLCKMVNFSRSVLKIYTGQKKFTRAAPVAPVTNIRYACTQTFSLRFKWPIIRNYDDDDDDDTDEKL